MSSWVNDVLYAIRVLLKHRAFSALAVGILAIAIGANTAIFSVVRAVLLDSLPYANASRLVVIWEDASTLGFPKNTPAPGNYADWKSQNSVFEEMAALRPRGYNLTGMESFLMQCPNALLACWIPARRAAGVDPGSVLHYE